MLSWPCCTGPATQYIIVGVCGGGACLPHTPRQPGNKEKKSGERHGGLTGYPLQEPTLDNLTCPTESHLLTALSWGPSLNTWVTRKYFRSKLWQTLSTYFPKTGPIFMPPVGMTLPLLHSSWNLMLDLNSSCQGRQIAELHGNGH